MATTRKHQSFESLDRCVDAVIEKVGKEIRLGLPLGLGKPVNLVNAIYQRARKDPSIKLHIFTALTLEKPLGGQSLERRFMGPFVERVFKGVPDIDYVVDLRQGNFQITSRSPSSFQGGQLAWS